ncbi:LLM class flavin-dependent oxidoreductase [Falsirhodobacter halotolerans]|uniref:LLM class flavin-dependent oxidoreductase n=1 Tax=Falsirhodobacter halotolerans TaxID=1146892 RepID=UPI001FD49015|nr:LLM class flavin-dependent oxidoreductase [Falsirhodobacter halotolerans]MCJ8139481.1 LLM class flavin-dependent oxidoreductase [Falsirhodobacter halotolerans]
MQKYSILDLSPVPEGSTTADALQSTLDLARHAEALGYHRFWLAEHHNMPGIASAATSVVIGHVAASTSRIRLGAGGIMLPNHTPLMIAEQFGTLATLYPNRIDLGVGRAPGTDMQTARALRRNMDAGDNFPQDVVELINYFDDAALDATVQAIPGTGTRVPVWILGSSLYGAQLAAYLGLPYAFASHFAPAALEAAAETYRQTFQPSRFLDTPYFMMAAGVFAADTAEEAEFVKSSQLQAFANLRLGRPGKLPRPVRDVEAVVPAPYLASAREALSVSATGTPDTVRDELRALVDRYQPDEMIVTSMIHDPTARKHSFTLAAEALRNLCASPALA